LHTQRGMMKIFTRVLVSAALTVSVSAFADDTAKTGTTKTDTTKPDTTKTAKPAKLKAQELQVMAHYHAVNQLEIDLGKAAEKKATSDNVKSYAKMLVTDHQDADKELTALAKKTGQMIPAEKPADATEKKEMADTKADATKLKTLKGADFERQYLRMMVQGHEKELANIDTNVAKLENAELVDAIKAKKDVLQKHADEARNLQKNEPAAMNDMPKTDTTKAPADTKAPSTAKR
jgi:putative membrane protein